MSGDEADEDADYDQPRIPAALRERIEALFVEYRGYEPATFQESLSLVADLAAARIEAEAAGSAEALDAPERTDDAFESAAEDAESSGSAPAEAQAEPVGDISTEVVDDAGEEHFAELEDDPADGRPGADAAGAAAGDDGPGAVDGPGSADIPEALRADPESNCALCGEVHPVSVLKTTIPEDADSIALVCPDCAE